MYDANRKPQRPTPQPSFYEQVRQYVAEAADVATALDVHLANLPAAAPWPAELTDKTLFSLLNAAGILSLNGRAAAKELPVPNTATKEGGYLVAAAAVRHLLFDCATLAQAIAHVQYRDGGGQLAVAEADRCWMAVMLDLASRLVAIEVAKLNRIISEGALPPSAPNDGPLFPPPSLN